MPEPVGRIKACTECRQQKVRCDAFLDYSRPCSRCRADNLPCIISKTFQRRKRRTKAQLQYELDQLQYSLDRRRSKPSEPHVRSPDDADKNESSSPEDDHASRPSNSRTASDESRSYPQTHANGTRYDMTDRSHRATLVLDPAKIYQAGDPSISLDQEGALRILGEVEMDATTVENNYQEFLENYAPHLEGLFDNSVTSAERYAKSPLLFWAMVCVGSRRSSGDKSTFSRLGGAVVDLAFRSCIRPEQPLFVILAIIVLCNWPVPTELSYKDPSVPLAGAALSLAIQNGLHVHFAEHEFIARSLDAIPSHIYVRPIAPSQSQDVHFIFRNRIWAYCISTFSATTIHDGLPPLSITASFRKPQLFEECAPLLPASIVYRVKMIKLCNEAINLASGLAEYDSNGSEQALSAMISSFDDRICAVPAPNDELFPRLTRCSMRLVVLGLHYLVQPVPDHAKCVLMYSVAKQLIDLAVQLNGNDYRFTFYMPHLELRSMLSAGHILLRIEKSALKEKLGMENVEGAFYDSINIIRRCSAGNDLFNISTVIMTQLWMSDKVFSHDGGPQNGLRVDLRHRISVSPMFDAFRWWRKLFGGQYLQQRAAEDAAISPSSPASPVNLNPLAAPSLQTHNALAPTHSQPFPDPLLLDPNMPLPPMDPLTSLPLPFPSSSSPSAPYNPAYPMALDDTYLYPTGAPFQAFEPMHVDEVFQDFMDWWDTSAAAADMRQMNLSAGMVDVAYDFSGGPQQGAQQQDVMG